MTALENDPLEINFLSSAVRNMITRKPILTVDRIVFVGLDAAGVPFPHGFTDITY